MRYQVIALKDEADSMVPVCIPIPILILFSRDTVDDESSAVRSIKASDDIQHCGFA